MTAIIENGKRRLRDFLVWGCLSACIVAIGLLFFWMFDSRVPVEVHVAYPIAPAFEVGEPIVIEERLSVHRRCPGTVARQIVDGANTAYSILMPSDPLLGTTSERLRVEFQMPKHLGPGRYRYRAEAVWQCNPLKPVRQSIADVPFVVTPAQEGE